MLTEKDSLVHWAASNFPHDIAVVRKQAAMRKTLKEGDLVWVMGRRGRPEVWRFVEATEDCVMVRGYIPGGDVEVRVNIVSVVRKLNKEESGALKERLEGRLRVFFGQAEGRGRS